MADWQVGDLALCVKVGPIGKSKGEDLALGAVYIVESVRTIAYNGFLGLRLAGVFCDPTDLAKGFKRASRFVKVTPPEADEFDREVIEQMTGQPAAVPQ